MTILELCMLLRVHIKKVIVVPILCGVICAVAAFGLFFVHPSYTATASVLSVGGDISTVSGLATSLAGKETAATVTATTTTSSKLVTLKAEGSSADSCVSAANSVANELSSTAVDQKAATSTVVTEAQSASKNGKNPLFYGVVGLLAGLFCIVAYYVLVDMMRGRIHASDAVSETGLTYLGTLDGDEAHQRVAVANLHFSGKNDGAALARTVLLVPTNDQVRIRDAYAQISQAVAAEGMQIGAAPSLDSGVGALYKGRNVDSVVAVIEAEVSTLAEVNELVHEFNVAGIKPGGFLYLPYSASSKKAVAAKKGKAAKKAKSSKKAMHQGPKS